MKIQSLSICVPAPCPNKCKFCVAHMHRGDYQNQIEKNQKFRRLYKEDFKKRLQFARDNGCNTIILTGDGEPLFNRDFVNDFAEWNSQIRTPFTWIEIQTSGISLNEDTLRWLRDTIGVTTISLSMSSLDPIENFEYNGTADKYRNEENSTLNLVKLIKKYDFNLRLSLNLTDSTTYQCEPEDMLEKCRNEFLADQITLRILYSQEGTPESDWVKLHRIPRYELGLIEEYIEKCGRVIGVLPNGSKKYSIKEMSVVLDGDCMSTEIGEDLRYLILRPDCKLYSLWDDKASLIF
jgi:hypothetical protein